MDHRKQPSSATILISITAALLAFVYLGIHFINQQQESEPAVSDPRAPVITDTDISEDQENPQKADLPSGDIVRFSGVVRKDDGDPLQGVNCHFVSTNGDDRFLVTTSPSGEFEFSCHPSYDIQYILFEHPYYIPVVLDLSTVDSQQLDSIIVQMKIGGIINLIVENPAAPDGFRYSVSIVQADNDDQMKQHLRQYIDSRKKHQNEASTRELVYSLLEVPDYQAQDIARSFTSKECQFVVPGGEYVIRVLSSDYPVAESESFAVHEGRTIDVHVRVVSGEVIEGVCVDENGNRKAGISLVAWPVSFTKIGGRPSVDIKYGQTVVGDSSRTVLTDVHCESNSDGTFQFTNVVKDQYYTIDCDDYSVCKVRSNYDHNDGVVPSGTSDIVLTVHDYPRIILKLNCPEEEVLGSHAIIVLKRDTSYDINDYKYGYRIERNRCSIPLLLAPWFMPNESVEVHIAVISNKGRYGEKYLNVDESISTKEVEIKFGEVCRYNLGPVSDGFEEVLTYWTLSRTTSRGKITSDQIRWDGDRLLSGNSLSRFVIMEEDPVWYIMQKEGSTEDAYIISDCELLNCAIVWESGFNTAAISRFGVREDKVTRDYIPFSETGCIRLIDGGAGSWGRNDYIRVVAFVGTCEADTIVAGEWRIRLDRVKEKSGDYTTTLTPNGLVLELKRPKKMRYDIVRFKGAVREKVYANRVVLGDILEILL